ncbi:MAG: amino acid permease [Deltaproteobacteria bacterium]|nr:amino acid permease [Candidatus Anaeroferrophillus wilburensis]MBN2889114.1 amino acid permease [Deltaproteobacteria bacterium]
MNSQPEANPSLQRVITLPFLIFYGLGNIVGAGIYVLIGEIAGIVGYQTPFSFLIALFAVLGTAFSYAELSSCFPVSAGEAVYVKEGYGSDSLAIFIGFLIICSGLVSSATLIRGFYGYCAVFSGLTEYQIIVLIGVILFLIAVWGIGTSVAIASLFTLVELGGLLVIIVVGSGLIQQQGTSFWELVPRGFSAWPAIFSGGFIAFYAFIGFEDMVNIAEEVKNPRVVMPMAIIAVLLLSTILYCGVAMVTVLAVDPAELARSRAPLAAVYSAATGRPATILSLIGMAAVINGALVQMIMVARMLYGMSRQHWLPALFSRVNPVTRTPVQSTALVVAMVVLLALWLPVLTLAKLTSFFILITFTLVNGALIRIKKHHITRSDIMVIPLWVPYAAIVINFLLLGSELMALMKGFFQVV